jgi:hypothetical protein
MSELDAVLKRSSDVKNYFESAIMSLSNEELNWKESPKKWSVLETVSHLNQVYELYEPKFEQVLANGQKRSLEIKTTKKQTTILGRLSIYSMLPKKRKRRFKMKTFDFFEPISNPSAPNETIQRFLGNKAKFDGFVIKSETLDITGLKVSTALGEKVRFFMPECFEFIMAHEERHIVQIEEILEKFSTLKGRIND